MQQLFISHAEEDQTLAVEIAGALERQGFTAWYYERDSVPGPSYLKQVIGAIAECKGVILIVSPVAMDSHIVDAEVYRAFETKKRFVPLLNGVTHEELETRMPEWVMMFRAAATIPIPPAGVSAILPQLEKGVTMMGIKPTPSRPSPTFDITNELFPPDRHGLRGGVGDSPAGAPGDEAVWTVFAPQECSPGDTTLVQLWLHTQAQAEAVKRSALEADEAAQPRGHGSIARRLARGGQLTLSLRAVGLEIDEPSQELTWRGEPEGVHFAVHVPEDYLTSVRIARAELSTEGRPLARLNFKLSIKDKVKGKEGAAGTTPGPAPGAAARPFVRYRKAYVSYAHQDRAEVLRRVQMLSNMGISVFSDLPGVTPGAGWEAQVKRGISEADVFFLFWSSAASRSEWVRHELSYALSLKEGDPGRPPEIIPVALEVPAPPPPPELAGLHFTDSLVYLMSQEGQATK